MARNRYKREGPWAWTPGWVGMLACCHVHLLSSLRIITTVSSIWRWNSGVLAFIRHLNRHVTAVIVHGKTPQIIDRMESCRFGSNLLLYLRFGRSVTSAILKYRICKRVHRCLRLAAKFKLMTHTKAQDARTTKLSSRQIVVKLISAGISAGKEITTRAQNILDNVEAHDPRGRRTKISFLEAWVFSMLPVIFACKGSSSPTARTNVGSRNRSTEFREVGKSTGISGFCGRNVDCKMLIFFFWYNNDEKFKANKCAKQT